jgi:hypothetical protein
MSSVHQGLFTGMAILFVNLMLVLLVALLPCANGATSTVQRKISSIFAFGDSIVDLGNNNNRPTEEKANFLPYGQDFPSRKATGSFSNGKVPRDMIGAYRRQGGN